MNPALPASHRGSITSVSTPQGSLAVGHWRPRRSAERPDSPVVVALHGITGNHRCWTYLADTLKECRVIAPDLRGRGGSAQVAGPFGLQTHADDVIRVLDALEIEQAVFVGHSMGGFVATIAAHRHPDRVRSIVLVDGGLPMTREIPADPEAVSEPVIKHLRRRLQQDFRSVNQAAASWSAHPALIGMWSPVIGDYVSYDLGGRPPRLHSRVSGEAVTSDARDVLACAEVRTALEELRHPTQFLVASRGLLGASPGLYPPEDVAHWLERYPRIQVHPESWLNHYTFVLSREGGRVVARAVQRALAESAPTPRPEHLEGHSHRRRPGVSRQRVQPSFS